MGNDCCQDAGRDESCCDTRTVEFEVVSEACDDVIDHVNHIRELVDEADKSPEESDVAVVFADACNSLTVAVGDLVREVNYYAEPDAGMEPTT